MVAAIRQLALTRRWAPTASGSDERGWQERSEAKRLPAMNGATSPIAAALRPRLLYSPGSLPTAEYRVTQILLGTKRWPRGVKERHTFCSSAGVHAASLRLSAGTKNDTSCRRGPLFLVGATRSGGQPSQGAKALSRGGMTFEWVTRHGAAPESHWQSGFRTRERWIRHRPTPRAEDKTVLCSAPGETTPEDEHAPSSLRHHEGSRDAERMPAEARSDHTFRGAAELMATGLRPLTATTHTARGRGTTPHDVEARKTALSRRSEIAAAARRVL